MFFSIYLLGFALKSLDIKWHAADQFSFTVLYNHKHKRGLQQNSHMIRASIAAAAVGLKCMREILEENYHCAKLTQTSDFQASDNSVPAGHILGR